MAFWTSWEKVQCCKISRSASLGLRKDPYLWNSFSSLKTVLNIKNPMLWSKDHWKKIKFYLFQNVLWICLHCVRGGIHPLCGMFRNTRQQSSVHFSNFYFKKEAIISLWKRPIISEFVVVGFFITAAATRKYGMAVTITGEHLGWAPHQAVFLRWHLDNFALKLPCGWWGVHGAFPPVWDSFFII